jgi:HD superfamily phosphodiesterase
MEILTMTEPQLTLDDIVQMTLQSGENWAVAHSRRLLELIKQIGVDLSYDAYVMELAAHLHDWGAFPAYIQHGVEHAVRSRQVVETEILPRLDLTAHQKEILLEAIELHDYRDTRQTKSNEALLLREADMLEFLGMIGMARDLARGPRNLQISYRRILDRRYGIQGRFTIARAQQIAQVRLEHMGQCLQWLYEEGFGVL